MRCIPKKETTFNPLVDAMFSAVLAHIENSIGFRLNGYEKLSGGDISTAFALHTSAGPYFLKLNEAATFPGMFAKEARGLQALRSSSALSIPDVIAEGEAANNQYLLLQWLETGSPKADCWEAFGTGLAIQHLLEQSLFGWPENNYIGSLEQWNEQHDNWVDFFIRCRIHPLVQKLVSNGSLPAASLEQVEQVWKKLPQIFPEEPPALLHGDLWSGNYLVGADGYAWIFDPAVYCGHREMDIGMTRLFGGFHQRFYQAYHQAYPLAPGWVQRLPLSQLYPLLVHALLFGGHYLAQSEAILKQYS